MILAQKQSLLFKKIGTDTILTVKHRRGFQLRLFLFLLHVFAEFAKLE